MCVMVNATQTASTDEIWLFVIKVSSHHSQTLAWLSLLLLCYDNNNNHHYHTPNLYSHSSPARP